MLFWGAVLGRYFCKNTEVSRRIFLPTRLFSRVYTYTFINFRKLFPPTRLFGFHVYSVVQSIFEGQFTYLQLEYFDDFYTFGILVNGLVNKILFLEQFEHFHFCEYYSPIIAY